jgi:hypothetical protein
VYDEDVEILRTAAFPFRVNRSGDSWRITRKMRWLRKLLHLLDLLLA